MKNTLTRFHAGNGASPTRIVRPNFRRFLLLGECGASLRGLFALLLLAMSFAPKAPAQANAGASAPTRYIEALQKGDFKTVIDLSYGYQGDVSRIKAQNPQVLWPKLTKEYYDAKIATLANKPGFWEAYMQGMMGDPAQQIHFMQSLLLPNVKWKVTETRVDHVQDSIQFGGYDRTVVYITVNYPTLNDSPFVDGKFIKETILEFDLNTKSQLVMALGRLPQGDTPWDAPLMIMNTSWQLEQAPFSGQIDGHLRAEAIGGKAPYAWTPKCGTFDLSKQLTKNDGLGRPIDQRNVPFLMVDLGRFPNNAFPLRCVVTVTDGAGQVDTVGMTVPKMLTGLNAYCYVRAPWFSRGQGRPGQPTTCIDPVLSTEAATASASLAEPPSPVKSADATPSVAGTPPSFTPYNATACGNEYIGCVSAGRNAMSSMDWKAAIADFEAAANLNQTSTDPWLALGRIYQRMGQNEELSKAWDKAIALGGTVAIAACLGRDPKSCERGMLSLSGSSIAFVVNGKPVLSASPSEISPGPALNGHEYSLQVGGTRYTFDFFPSGVNCAYNKAMVQCPPEGVPQQLTLAQYVSHAVSKLVRGTPAKEP